mmetsp:Transcript_26030/g.4466  ORF Transcript_26030/g.4466 Transcript_26030/m.4466 type:complete len:86 (+) Transcript_26030:148-405(+)
MTLRIKTGFQYKLKSYQKLTQYQMRSLYRQFLNNHLKTISAYLMICSNRIKVDHQEFILETVYKECYSRMIVITLYIRSNLVGII